MSAPQGARPRRRVAMVVQRYGREIDGGSETLCREVAERLVPAADVEVLTTTAIDYLTWANELPAGERYEQGVVVRRFPPDASERTNLATVSSSGASRWTMRS